MSTEIAIILSAIIAAGISLLTLLITRVFDARSEKRKEQERFFYEIFPKRLELYEEIIKKTDFIGNNADALLCISLAELVIYYTDKGNILADLSFRCTIFGSARVVSALALLVDAIANICQLIMSLDESPDTVSQERLINSFTPSAISIKNKLLELIREESGTDMIDKKTADFLRDFKKKQNLNNEPTY